MKLSGNLQILTLLPINKITISSYKYSEINDPTPPPPSTSFTKAIYKSDFRSRPEQQGGEYRLS